MLFQLFCLIVLGLIIDYLFKKIKIPSSVGWLTIGIISNSLNLFNKEFVNILVEFEILAFLIVLLKVSFDIDLNSLKRVSKRIILMSFIPCIFEIIFIAIIAYYLIGLSFLESIILGNILSAVSPSIVTSTNKMQKINTETKADIKTLILISSSFDDVVSMISVMYFISLYIGKDVSLIKNIAHIPSSILVGILIGIIIALILCKVLNKYNKYITNKSILLLFIASGLFFINGKTKIFSFSSVISTLTIGAVIANSNYGKKYSKEVINKINSLWIFAQILLFTSIGTKIDLSVINNVKILYGIIIISFGIIGRSTGILLCLINSKFKFKEKMIITTSFMPKDIVQATICSLPLNAMITNNMNIIPGQIILSISVLSIIITGPISFLVSNYDRYKFLRNSKKNN